jgi:uncharacterized protein
MPDDVMTTDRIATEELREILGEPVKFVLDKVLSELEEHSRHFISLSPFLCLGTSSAAGDQDVSPRGDPPGFVKVIDNRTILIPERPGNRRADSMLNLIENPKVAVIFMLPGVEINLRMNGTARVVQDPELLSGMEVRGKAPKLGILVEIKEVYFHCAKAIIRSRLWDPETQIDRKDFPSHAQITRDQQDPGGDLSPHQARIEDSAKNHLY